MSPAPVSPLSPVEGPIAHVLAALPRRTPRQRRLLLARRFARAPLRSLGSWVAAPSSRLVSNLRVLWYALDCVLGHALRVLPRRRNALVVFDRTLYDYLVDPERYRVRGRTLLAIWLARLVPRPDAVIVVTARLEVAQARRCELSAPESVPDAARRAA